MSGLNGWNNMPFGMAFKIEATVIAQTAGDGSHLHLSTASTRRFSTAVSKWVLKQTPSCFTDLPWRSARKCLKFNKMRTRATRDEANCEFARLLRGKHFLTPTAVAGSISMKVLSASRNKKMRRDDEIAQ